MPYGQAMAMLCLGEYLRTRQCHDVYSQDPRMNHHFAQYPSATAAFEEKDGQVKPEPAVGAMLKWLKQILATPT